MQWSSTLDAFLLNSLCQSQQILALTKSKHKSRTEDENPFFDMACGPECGFRLFMRILGPYSIPMGCKRPGAAPGQTSAVHLFPVPSKGPSVHQSVRFKLSCSTMMSGFLLHRLRIHGLVRDTALVRGRFGPLRVPPQLHVGCCS